MVAIGAGGHAEVVIDVLLSLDVWYVENWNILLDLKIIFLIILKVLKRDEISQPRRATVDYFRGYKVSIRIDYAANRKIGVEALKILVSYNIKPAVLILLHNGDYKEEMISLVPDIPYIIWKKFREIETIDFLRSLELDYILSIHFPYIIPK